MLILILILATFVGSFVGACVGNLIRFRSHHVTVIEQNHPDAPHVVAQQVRDSFTGVSP